MREFQGVPLSVLFSFLYPRAAGPVNLVCLLEVRGANKFDIDEDKDKQKNLICIQ